MARFKFKCMSTQIINFQTVLSQKRCKIFLFDYKYFSLFLQSAQTKSINLPYSFRYFLVQNKEFSPEKEINLIFFFQKIKHQVHQQLQ